MKFKNQNYAFFTVFYRDLPRILENSVKSDGRMSIIKDGVKKLGDQKIPRITISIESTDLAKDIKRVESMEQLLSQLESNNQIASFRLRRTQK